MKSTTHFAMAHILYASLQKRGIYLNRIAFVYGNIAPDYLPTMIVPAHFTKVCSRMISKVVTNLSETPICSNGRVGAEYSRQLGIMCHFLCDYFCFAHNDIFMASVKQHIEYENELDAFMRHNCLNILDIEGNDSVTFSTDKNELISNLEEAKSNYLKIGYTFHNDLTSAFNSCITAVVNLVSLSQKIPAASTFIEIEDFITSLKSYATGKNMVFRMFFYRNRNNNIFFLPELMPPIFAFALS